MSYYNHLDRAASGLAISQRDKAIEELCAVTGQPYDDVSRQMDDACSDAPGIARHHYEAAWAKRQLEKARQ